MSTKKVELAHEKACEGGGYGIMLHLNEKSCIT